MKKIGQRAKEISESYIGLPLTDQHKIFNKPSDTIIMHVFLEKILGKEFTGEEFIKYINLYTSEQDRDDIYTIIEVSEAYKKNKKDNTIIDDKAFEEILDDSKTQISESARTAKVAYNMLVTLDKNAAENMISEMRESSLKEIGNNFPGMTEVQKNKIVDLTIKTITG